MKAGPALRVAAAATLVLAIVYAVAAVVLYVVVWHRLTSQADARLRQRVGAARHAPRLVGQRVDLSDAHDEADVDPDQVPVFLWSVSGDGTVTGRTPGAPALNASAVERATTTPVSVTLGPAGSFRLLSTRAASTRAGGERLIAGLSLAGAEHTEHLVRDAEILAGPLLLLAMFGGSLVVGLRALAPAEQARRRQLEFTADASHELRTPLSVLRAEVDLALSSRRSPAEYRDSLTRIGGESDRLRRLVDDLLWLARFDSQPPPPGDEPVDLGVLAQACADRFRSVGPAITVALGSEPVLITAPPEWIDRLAGVLMDNACRYAGPDGRVRISVRAQGSRIALTVEDSGPGIPRAARPRLFDRFQRAEENGPGAGLGLAIGDSIVGSTGGRWRIGTSPFGGAQFEVSWRGPHRHREVRSDKGEVI